MTMRLLAVLALLLVSAATWLDGRAPVPVPTDADPGVFSADRAMRTVDDLVDGPRPGGSQAAGAARDAIAARLSAAGLTTRLHSSTGIGGADGRLTAAPVDNLVATLPGTDPTGAVVLSAHYDSVASGGPGAADDMASVAAILEAVRAMREGPPLRNDLVVLITDAEEVGLLGMQAWVRDELSPSARPTVTVNFEARGVSGPSLMFRTSPGNAGLARVFADAVPHPTGDSSLVEMFRLLPNDTDLTRVIDAGRPGVDVAFVEQPVQYHTTGDAPENLSAASMQGHGEAALGLARALGNQDLAPLDPAASGAAPQGDATYFRLARGRPSCTRRGWRGRWRRSGRSRSSPQCWSRVGARRRRCRTSWVRRCYCSSRPSPRCSRRWGCGRRSWRCTRSGRTPGRSCTAQSRCRRPRWRWPSQ